MVQSAIDGYNVCIFAYGQTGSGKTHTMVGDNKKPGIVPRALSHLFDLLSKLGKSSQGYTSSVSCYMLELYNEQLLDMLVDEKEVLLTTFSLSIMYIFFFKSFFLNIF